MGEYGLARMGMELHGKKHFYQKYSRGYGLIPYFFKMRWEIIKKPNKKQKLCSMGKEYLMALSQLGYYPHLYK